MLTIGICTRERPKMLAALLESLAVSVTQAGADVKILLVENGPPTGAKEVAEQFAGRLEIAYTNEPRVGLVYARNAVVEAFLAGGYPQIALLDDDASVVPEWVSAMLKGLVEFPDADMLVGQTLYTYNESAPRILRERRQVALPHGRKTMPRTTNNVLLTRRIFDDGATLHKFDMRFNFSGAEDYEFFRRCQGRGFICRFVREARSVEHVIESRQSLSYVFEKWRHQAHCGGVIMIFRQGPWRGRLLVLFALLRDAALVVIFFIGGTIVLVGSEHRGLDIMRRGVRSLAALTGRPRALWRDLGAAYAKVEGH